MSDLHERLLAATEPAWHIWAPSPAAEGLAARERALKAVVELHIPTDIGGGLAVCAECDSRWSPCSTIQTIADALGVEIGETPK